MPVAMVAKTDGIGAWAEPPIVHLYYNGLVNRCSLTQITLFTSLGSHRGYGYPSGCVFLNINKSDDAQATRYASIGTNK